MGTDSEDIRSEINSTDHRPGPAGGECAAVPVPPALSVVGWVLRTCWARGPLAAPREHGAHLHFPPALGGGLCVGQLIITESGDTGKQRGEKAGLMHLTFLENRGGQVFLPHEINVP